LLTDLLLDSSLATMPRLRLPRFALSEV
jgi:hypothetical protein